MHSTLQYLQACVLRRKLLADFKTSIGVPTVVRTIEWVLANYPREFDVPATIRKFIADAASHWGTVYVLLGADTEIIPTRLAVPNPYSDESDQIVTDYYYSCLDGNWNGDGDHLFGEKYIANSLPGDDVDLLPDVFIGRLPSTTTAEAELLVDKVLDYVRIPPLTEFATQALMLGEVIDPQHYTPGADSVWLDGALIAEDARLQISLPFEVDLVRLYENYPDWSGSLPESLESVQAKVNLGFNLIHHVGHGFVNTMSVGLNSSTLVNSTVLGFTNSNQGVVYAATCAAATITQNCIAEAWVLNEEGGAVGVIAASHLNAVVSGWDYQKEWFAQIFQEGNGHLGTATALARVNLVPRAEYSTIYRETLFGQTLVGDPEMWFYTEDPESLVVSIDGSALTLGQDTLGVSVTRDGSPADSFRVCAFKDGDAYAVGWTDANGDVTLAFDPDTTGSFTIGVWGPNSIPNLDTLDVIAPFGPHLYVSAQAIDDDSSGPSNGNNNGEIDSGETVELSLTLSNEGGSTATSVQARLECAHWGVSG